MRHRSLRMSAMLSIKKTASLWSARMVRANRPVSYTHLTVEVLDTTSKWFGVTYPEDRQSVVDKIQALVDAGEYPAKLF